jgi:4'-phosphopantetheinyl transferase
MNAVWDCVAEVQPFSGPEIHVYSAHLDGPNAQNCERLLSAEERVRAEQFRFEKDSARFIVARATLRTILGQYLGVHPTNVQFTYEVNGKPILANRQKADQILHFNVSHSQGLALYAVSNCAPLGVDVEFLRPIPDMAQIARSYFSKGEYAALSAVPAAHQVHAFYKCWTSKEAFIKATGDGLSFVLDRFEVELRPDHPSQLLSLDGDTDDAAAWTLKELAPGPGYIGAVAIRRRDVAISCKAWRSVSDTRP